MAAKKPAKKLSKKDMKKTVGGEKKATTTTQPQQTFLKVELENVQITSYQL